MWYRARNGEGFVLRFVGDVFGCPFLEGREICSTWLFAPEESGASGGGRAGCLAFNGEFLEADSERSGGDAGVIVPDWGWGGIEESCESDDDVEVYDGVSVVVDMGTFEAEKRSRGKAGLVGDKFRE